ncbi:hypothetical protein [Burkholderia territorii]|uniref:hypothetical protein n=1 Tax=Burkholderia territorii TaxID=1503055 RepID=UPI000B2AC805|nr:hypothetical protein [Burkholderia territorii]
MGKQDQGRVDVTTGAFLIVNKAFNAPLWCNGEPDEYGVYRVYGRPNADYHREAQWVWTIATEENNTESIQNNSYSVLLGAASVRDSMDDCLVSGWNSDVSNPLVQWTLIPTANDANIYTIFNQQYNSVLKLGEAEVNASFDHLVYAHIGGGYDPSDQRFYWKLIPYST